MKNKLLFLITFLAMAGIGLFGQSQQSSYSNPVGGNITASGANCANAGVCVWQKLPATATTTTVTITGTFSETLIIETSADGGNTFTQQSSQTATAVVTFTTTSLTDVRVRCSAFTSGNAGVNIQTAGNQQNITINSGSSSGGVTITTVSGLASVPGKTKGTIAVVTDGSTATDCVTGSGTNVVVCQYSGSSWAQMVASSSGSTAFSALTPSTNTASGFALAPTATGTVPFTVTGPSGITVDIYDWLLGATKEMWLDSGGVLHLAQSPGFSIGGNAGTATALASTPANCGAGVAAIGVLANGNATGCFTPGGLTNPMTTLGDIIYENATPAPARLAGATTPNGVPQTYTSTPSGGVATAVALALPGMVGRAITGTTATDTIVSTDCNPKRIEYVGSVAVAITLPTATTLAVPNCVFRATNALSTVNDLTVTTTTWTCNGVATCIVHNGQLATFYVDPNIATNWVMDVTETAIVAGPNITLTRTGNSLSIASTGGGTPTYPVTVAGTVTSGGIPCFTSTTQSSSSGLMTTNVYMKGGGVGVCPSPGLTTDDGTSSTYTGTGGTKSPAFTSTGTTAGFVDYPQGTTSAAVAPCNTATSICEQAPTAVTSYLLNKPGAAPTIASYKQTDTCGSAICTESFHPVPIVLRVTADFTDTSSTTLQAITGLGFTFPANQALNAKVDCDILYNQTVAAVADAWGVQDVTVAPTNVEATGFTQTAATTWAEQQLLTLTTTTATNIGTFTPSAITTVWHAQLHALIEHPSNASTSAFNVMVSQSTAADLMVIKRGSACTVTFQ